MTAQGGGRNSTSCRAESATTSAGLLLRHGVDAPEQVGELAGRRDPEQAFGHRVRLVEDAVRLALRQAHEVARRRGRLLPAQDEVEPALQDVEVLVLGRMDVRRDEGAGREGGVPGEGLAVRLLGT